MVLLVPKPDRKELLERFNSGEEEAFLEVYDVLAPQILRHLLLRTGSREVAEDLVSTTFLKAWEYVRRGTEVRNLKAFLYRIAQNLLIDYWRRRPTTEVSLEISSLAFSSQGLEENPVELASLKIDIRIVHEELQELKPEYRDMIIWRYVDELTVSEVASISGKSVAAVYVTIHRALKALRKRMERRTGNTV